MLKIDVARSESVEWSTAAFSSFTERAPNYPHAYPLGYSVQKELKQFQSLELYKNQREQFQSLELLQQGMKTKTRENSFSPWNYCNMEWKQKPKRTVAVPGVIVTRNENKNQREQFQSLELLPQGMKTKTKENSFSPWSYCNKEWKYVSSRITR